MIAWLQGLPGRAARFALRRSTLLSALTVVAMFAAWWVVTATGLANKLFLPAPDAVWRAFLKPAFKGCQGATLQVHVGVSLPRILAAFFAAIIVGVPLGILMGVSRAAVPGH